MYRNEQPLREEPSRETGMEHAIAAEFRDKSDAVNAVRELEARGVSDKDIRVLLPPGASAGQFKGETGAQPHVIGGGGILDQLSNLFGGGMSGLSDLGFNDRERHVLEDVAKRGHYVVAVKCDGQCPNIHPLLSKYNGHEITPQGYETRTRERQGLRERAQREAGAANSVAAAFSDRNNAANAVRELTARGISDKDICLLAPPEGAGRFGGASSGQPRVISGGSIVDQLSNVFTGGPSGLSDLGFSDQEQKAMEDAATHGEFVVAVRCGETCREAENILFRWSGRRVAPVMDEEARAGERRLRETPQGEFQGERTLRERPQGEYGEERPRPDDYEEGHEGHYAR
jgi:hypothetical protein